MARSIQDTNDRLFRRLKSFLPSDEITKVSNASRRILINEEELEIIKQCKVELDILCLPSKKVIGIRYEDRYFVVLPEVPFESDIFMKGVIGQSNENAGLYSVIWGEKEHPLNDDDDDVGYKLLQYIFGREGDYSFSELKDFFVPCDIWEIDPSEFGITVSEKTLLKEKEFLSRLRTTCFRVYGGFLSNDISRLNLSYKAETLVKITQLIEDAPAVMIGEVVFKALTATHWEHAFLELYRCVERLYSVPKVQKLCDALGNGMSIRDVIPEVEKHLGWHPREEDALIDLFKLVDNATLMDLFKNAFSADSNSNKAIAKKTYELRNQIAHWRPSGDIPNAPKDWDLVIRLLCEFITELYGKLRVLY